MPTADFTDWADYAEIQISESEESDRIGVIRGKDFAYPTTTPGVLLACLVQNPISFAYTSADRQPVSALLFQPVVLAYIGHGFYVKFADATWAMDWRHGTPTTLPLSLGLGYVRVREGWPPINVFVTGEWMAYRQYARLAPQTTVRFGMTMAFPELKLW